MSFGKIYPVTWWGKGVYNDISWGDTYLSDSLSDTYINYESRIAADAGTFETSICLMSITRDY